MKKDLSSLDIHYLVEELKARLPDAKIDKVFLDEKEALLQMHVPREGITYLRIIPPSFMCLTAKKGEYPEPNNFCMGLRKNLGNARLRDIRQIGSERIVALDFELKEGMLELVIELFAKGNILLLNDKKIIVIAKSYPKTKERTIRGGIEYTYPSKRYNLFSITDEELARLIAESDRETIVKTLAMDLGLGGGYSEEACHLAGIDKNKKKVDENAAKRLFEAILRMRTSTPGPCVYEDEFAPFELTKKQQPPISRPETLSVAIEEYYEKHLNSAKESKWALQLSAEKDKLLKIIERQKTHIDELGAEAEECQRKGELIYSSYSVVQEAITSLRQARQKHSWKEIKERLQGNQLVKGINEKEGMLELEL